MAFWFVFGIPALYAISFFYQWASFYWRIERICNEIEAEYARERVRVQQYDFNSSDWTGKRGK